MSCIILSTINSKYIHAAFGLRYLMANLQELANQSQIIEFDCNQRPIDMAEVIVAHNPKILGLGVYIWNAISSLELVKIIKKIRPDIKIVLGGPEVSYEIESQEITKFADFIISGEADFEFYRLCKNILIDQSPDTKIIHAELPDVAKLKLPYELYSADDTKHRVIYVEASRGCAFKCEFCLSSLDIPVRQFPLENFLQAMQSLLNRGVRQFKFVDRTFNINIRTSKAILEFFLQRYTPGLFVHFEMIPDRLPQDLREIIKQFPAGSLQFEVGIQSFNVDVNKLISRRQDFVKLEDNLKFLRNETGVHIHADLIAGLPGETLDSFANGFDRLVSLNPHEIQLGILKRLRGTPISRHDQTWGMHYHSQAPYEVLKNSLIDFADMQRLKRFSRYWDLIANSGNFKLSKQLIWHNIASPFWAFMEFSDWVFSKISRRHAISLDSLCTLLAGFLLDIRKLEREIVLSTLKDDYQSCGRNELPLALRLEKIESSSKTSSKKTLPKRQSRHHAEITQQIHKLT